MSRGLKLLAVIIGMLVVIGIGLSIWIERAGVVQVSAAVDQAGPALAVLRLLTAIAIIGWWPRWAPWLANKFHWNPEQRYELLRARWPAALLLLAVEVMAQIGSFARSN